MKTAQKPYSIRTDPTRQEEWMLKGIFAGVLPGENIGAVLPRMAENAREWVNFLARSSLSPIFYNFLKSGGYLESTPYEILAPCSSAYNTSVARNILHHEELGRLADIFHKQGIPMVPLKGAILSKTVYPHMGTRPMSDLDVMVPRARFFESIKILESAGYENKYAFMKGNPPPYHSGVQFIRRDGPGNILELHWNIINPRGIKSAFIAPEKLLMQEEEMNRWLTPGSIDGSKIYFLSDEFQYLSLVYHHFTHSFTDGIWFLDLVLLLGDPRFTTPPERLAAAATRFGLDGICMLHVETCRALWPMPEYMEKLRELLADGFKKRGINIEKGIPIADSPAAVYRVAKRLLFVPKSYFETIKGKPLGAAEYISLYAKHLSSLAGRARSGPVDK